MTDTLISRGLIFTLMIALTACSSEPSLTAEELASQHPDKHIWRSMASLCIMNNRA
jgi:hypothetical protein